MLSLSPVLTAFCINSKPILTHSYCASFIKNIFVVLVTLETSTRFETILIIVTVTLDGISSPLVFCKCLSKAMNFFCSMHQFLKNPPPVLTHDFQLILLLLTGRVRFFFPSWTTFNIKPLFTDFCLFLKCNSQNNFPNFLQQAYFTLIVKRIIPF